MADMNANVDLMNDRVTGQMSEDGRATDREARQTDVRGVGANRSMAERRWRFGASGVTLASFLGGVGLLLLSTAARAQDPAPATEPEGAAPVAPEASDPVADPAAAPLPAEPGVEAPADIAAEPTATEGLEPLPEDVDDVIGDSGGIDEVVVTVDRRQKNLQKYSGTASAFTERQLTTLGITSVRQLSSMVPGLQIGTQEGSTEVFIRGIGSDNNSEHGDPATALHIDGIYIPRPRGLGSMFFDIERVEVNSGPQGTLRGRNALAGSVNIVSVKPKLGEFGANAEATFGTFSLRRFQGMVNVPLGDTIALRAAGFSEIRDPYWINAGQVYDIRPAEDADNYALRGQARWQPTRALNILVGYDVTNERGTGWSGTNFHEYLTAEDTNGTPDQGDDVAIPLQVEDIDNPRRVNYFGMQPHMELKHEGVRAEVTFDAGPVLFELLGSYRDLHYEHNTGSSDGLVWEDPDGAGPLPGYDWSRANFNPDAFGQSFSITESKSYVAELRAFAPDTARLRWTVGGFFFREDQQAFLGQTNDPANGYGGQEFMMKDVPSGSVAAYADATFDVAESFRVLGGARVTREFKDRKNGFWGQWGGIPGGADTDPIVGTGRFGTEGFRYENFDRSIITLPAASTVEDRVNLFLNGIESFGSRDQVPQVLCNDPPAAAAGAEQLPRLNPGPNGGFECAFGVNDALGEDAFNISVTPQNNHDENTFFDWRLGAEYDLATNSMLYATVSTGHKAGGYNDTLNIGGGQPLYNSTYDPESVLAFELGSKNMFNDRKIRLNASAFLYRYSDMVFQILREVIADPDPNDMTDVSSSTSVRDNATNANIMGLDVDFVYALPAGLEAEVHALIMDARFGDSVLVNDGRLGFDLSQYVVDIGGNWLPRASPYTINYTLSQLIPTESGLFNWVISGQTRGKHYMTPFNGEGSLTPPVNPDQAVPEDENGLPTSQAYRDLLRDNGAIRLTDVVPTYTRFDVGIGWRHPESRLSIDGFVNNVFNIAYATTIISTPNLNLRFFNPPRTAGVRIRIDW
jgi:iron complex outermembrane recepter protein